MIEQVFTGSEVIFQVLRFFLTFALGVTLTRTVLMPAAGKLMTRREILPRRPSSRSRTY